MFRFSTILCLAFLLTQALPAPAAGPDYVLSRYHADFELVKDGDGKPRDARITLDITYELRNGTKDQGFKYVGTRPIPPSAKAKHSGSGRFSPRKGYWRAPKRKTICCSNG